VVDPATGVVLVTIPRLKKSPTPYETIEDFTTRLNTTTAFGRAIPSGAYKVVRLVHGDSCWVSCLGDDTGWKPRHPPEARVVASYPGSLTVVNGILYVLTSEEEMLGVLHWDMIHCFDLESEEWTETIKIPEKAVGRELWRNQTRTVRLAELNDNLCVVQQQLTRANIWLLTDSNKKTTWVKAFTIQISPDTYHFMPLRITHSGGRLLFQCSLFRRRAQVVKSYNPCTTTCTTIIETPENLESKISLCSSRLGSFIPDKI
jgi:F-box interacting protein